MEELQPKPAPQVVETQSAETGGAPLAEIEAKSTEAQPAPFEIINTQAQPAPELVPVARVKESAPPKLAAGILANSGENNEGPPGQGLPVWVMVVGLAVLIIVGILLVSFALK